jgi:hypothetical protein
MWGYIRIEMAREAYRGVDKVEKKYWLWESEQ